MWREYVCTHVRKVHGKSITSARKRQPIGGQPSNAFVSTSSYRRDRESRCCRKTNGRATEAERVVHCVQARRWNYYVDFMRIETKSKSARQSLPSDRSAGDACSPCMSVTRAVDAALSHNSPYSWVRIMPMCLCSAYICSKISGCCCCYCCADRYKLCFSSFIIVFSCARALVQLLLLLLCCVLLRYVCTFLFFSISF